MNLPVWNFGKPLPPLSPDTRVSDYQNKPDWVQANANRIEHALARALARPSGNWYVVDASRNIKDTPQAFRICNQDLVVWRTQNAILAAPNACPHMGASLACGKVEKDRLVCPWHGLALGPEGHGKWKPLRTYDDGVLLWVQMPTDDSAALTEKPFITERPKRFVDAVIRMEAECEPRDVIANRLDPWHGVHFHPHSFARLRVIETSDDSITVRVAYRVVGPLCVEVDARFHSPEPRTIAMTIVAGEGKGSVVETHATPLSEGRTAIIEATLATSERTAFRLARTTSGLLRPLIQRSARRLWEDDRAYAERQYYLRGHA